MATKVTHKREIDKIANQHWNDVLDFVALDAHRRRMLKNAIKLAVIDGYELGMENATKIFKKVVK